MQRAAQSLNVSPTIMKAHLRYLGVSKWPSRKRSTLHRLLRHAPDLQGHPRRKVSIPRLQGVCCLTSVCSLRLLKRSVAAPCNLLCHVSKLQGPSKARLQWVLGALFSCCVAVRKCS